MSERESPSQCGGGWLSSWLGQCCKHVHEAEGELREPPLDRRDHSHAEHAEPYFQAPNGGSRAGGRGAAQGGVPAPRAAPGASGRGSDPLPGERPYLIDNRILKIDGPPGIAYRYSKQHSDKVGAEVPSKVARWGDVVHGVDEGAGWLRVGQYYLPMLHKGTAVITPVPPLEPRLDEPEAASRAAPPSSSGPQRQDRGAGGVNVSTPTDLRQQQPHAQQQQQPQQQQQLQQPPQAQPPQAQQPPPQNEESQAPIGAGDTFGRSATAASASPEKPHAAAVDKVPAPAPAPAPAASTTASKSSPAARAPQEAVPAEDESPANPPAATRTDSGAEALASIFYKVCERPHDVAGPPPKWVLLPSVGTWLRPAPCSASSSAACADEAQALAAKALEEVDAEADAGAEALAAKCVEVESIKLQSAGFQVTASSWRHLPSIGTWLQARPFDLWTTDQIFCASAPAAHTDVCPE
eukprot:CAMPEP_0183439144 /NCGR_PEP_ID=MMETSP0370-20130417/77821_1 /TAXON_ID=268820 /ORGANISM="Peridinium aciculiferum, Strain PAER-2" /LENGTH=465 /DNA_ID=CAMNT_0025627525 /DNA_START=150 /DNA_END=1544 /DNA_ORIENTATION=-